MTDTSKKVTASRKKPAEGTKPKAPKTAAKKKPVAPKASAKQNVPARSKSKTSAKPTVRAAQSTATPDTVVSITANVGFGNQLFIRGEGAGLAWDRGIPMTCTHAWKWEWTARNVTSPLIFKVLINDQLWSSGENFEIQPGEHKVVEPDF